jgi:hypothetical protein
MGRHIVSIMTTAIIRANFFKRKTPFLKVQYSYNNDTQKLVKNQRLGHILQKITAYAVDLRKI